MDKDKNKEVEKDKLEPDIKVNLSRYEKKKPIQLMTLSYRNIPAFSTTDSIIHTTRLGIQKAIKQYVTSNPKLAVLFADNYNLFKLANTFPCDSVILNLPNIIIQSQFSHSLIFEPTGEKPRSIANTILFVGDEYVHVKYDFHFLDDPDLESFIDRLLMSGNHDKTLILFVSGPPYDTMKQLSETRALMDKAIDILKERRRRGSRYTCWGGEARMFINDSKMVTKSNQPFIFGVNVFGVNVQSYSATIDTSNMEDFIIHLTFIRKRIIFKRYSIGFVNTSRNIESREYYLKCIEVLKQMFPETTFTCVSRFQDKDEHELLKQRVLGYDSLNMDAQPVLDDDVLMSLLFITFDRSNHSGSEDFQLVNDDGEVEGVVEGGPADNDLGKPVKPVVNNHKTGTDKNMQPSPTKQSKRQENGSTDKKN